MSEIREHVAYLSQEIGPRPAGTEEEQKAAQYLADVFEKKAGLETSVEEFNFNADFDLPRAVYCALTLIVALLTLFLPVMVVPALIVSLITAALFAVEAFGVSPLAKLMNKGVSQNVVAKYRPANGGDDSHRRRKVMIVAHYDSGRVRRDLTSPIFPMIPMLRWAELFGMCLVPVLMLIRLISSADGAALVVLNVLVVICMVLAALPVAAFALTRASAYNEGANCNASGVAVAAEVAERVSRGGMIAAESFPQNATMHGEAEAMSSGLIPEGAQFAYEGSSSSADLGGESPKARLLAAKAAIAAMSGQPVSDTVSIDISDEPDVPVTPADHGVLEEARTEADQDEITEAPVLNTELSGTTNAASQAAEAMTAAGMQVAASGSAAAPVAFASAERVASTPHEIPAWYTNAQAKARKNHPADDKPVHRSRYADALDAAVRESSSHFAMANQAISAEAEQRLKQMRDNIMEVKAPGFDEVGAIAASAQVAPVQESTARFENALPTESAAAHVASAQPAVMQSDQKAAEQPAVDQSTSEPSVEPAAVVAAAPADSMSQPAEVPMIREASVERAPIGHPTGVGGYLSEATTAETYRQAREQYRAEQFEANRASSALEVEDAAVSAGAPSGSSPVAAASAASVPPVKADAAEIAAENLERTIAFIPVAADATGESEGQQGEPMLAAEEKQALDSLFDEAGYSAAANTSAKAARKKRDITLPSFTGSFAPIDESQKQRAPLADRAEGIDAVQKLRGTIPSIGAEQASNAARQQALRSSLPSLSGAIPMGSASQKVSALDLPGIAQDGMQTEIAADESTESEVVSHAGAFGPIGATGAFAPVGDELVEDVAPDDLFVEDVDDSAYEEQMTETGAFAGPGYVEMPKSRMGRLFSKFHFGKKKHQQEETTPQEWIGVDDDFEAREVGKARGSWDSFRQDDESGQTQLFQPLDNVSDRNQDQGDSWDDEYDDYADFDDYYDDGVDDGPGSRRWNGGGFSLAALDKLKQKVKKSEGHEESAADASRKTPRARRAEAEAARRSEAEAQAVQDFYAEGEEMIRGFRYASINMEVWFVALGSELAGNGGMKAFMAEHADDLKGAIFIDLDGMGAGQLTLIEQEGEYRSVKPSSRMKRFARKAGSTLGMAAASGTMLWRESAAACAMRQGHQAMHLVGMENGKPALCGEPDDVLENVSEDAMLANADFVVEVLKNI